MEMGEGGFAGQSCIKKMEPNEVVIKLGSIRCITWAVLSVLDEKSLVRLD